MKKLLFTLLFIVITLCSYSHGKLKLKLSLDKKIYYESQTITARLKFINNDTVPVKIGGNCSLEDDIIHHLKFETENGFKNRAHGLIVDCVTDSYILKPGEEFECYGASINLNRFYIFAAGIKNLMPGNYKVYYDGKYGKSDTVEINVISDCADFREFNKLKKILNKKELIYECRKYLDSDIVSPYNNYYLDELTRSLELYNAFDNPYKELLSDLVKFFKKEPDAWYNDIYIIYFSFYLRKIYSNDKMMEYLRKLTKECPETRVYIIAKEILTSNKIPNFVF